jgi:hypothetical protein
MDVSTRNTATLLLPIEITIKIQIHTRPVDAWDIRHVVQYVLPGQEAGNLIPYPRRKYNSIPWVGNNVALLLPIE